MRADRLGNGWPGTALAVLAGALLPLAFAPVSFYPLAVLSPAVLFWLWQDCAVARAFRLGFAFGLGMFGVGVSWVYVAIHDFGYTGVAVAGLLTALFVAFLALFPAVLGAVSVGLARRWLGPARQPALRLLLLFPAAWTALEWVRGWFLTGFPWLNLGYSQIDAPLAGWAPVLGVYAVSWATALSAGLLLWALQSRGRRRVAAVLALAGLWAVGAALLRVAWTHPTGKPLQVSLIQGDVPQNTKWTPEELPTRIRRYGRLTREHWDSAIIVWPENAMTDFYSRLEPDFLGPLAEEARRHGSEIILGVPVLDPATDRYYAAMVSIGATHGVYLKRHLVPFGEYVPMEHLLRGLIGFFDLPMSSFSRGPAHQAPLVAAGQPLATTLCYEDAFGEDVIKELPQATLLLNGSNNAWYGDSMAPAQHLQISRMRALETGRDLMRATTNGISALVGAHGQVLARSPQFETYVLTGKVQPRAGATPYVDWGNSPVLIGLAAAFALVWGLGRRARGPAQSAGVSPRRSA